MDLNYPQVGFHFLVVFELFPQLPNDFRFQEVSGLTVSMEMETIKEGGENRFVHQLPVRSTYNALVLKRGKFLGRSEEHTSELQSRENLVCRLLLEKK